MDNPKRPAAKKAAKAAPAPAPAAAASSHLPRQARANPTLADWVASETNRAFVAGLLRDPRFLALLHYSTEIHRISLDDLVGARPQLNAVITRKAAIRAGAEAFEELLKNILRQGPQAPQPEPWEYITPDIK